MNYESRVDLTDSRSLDVAQPEERRTSRGVVIAAIVAVVLAIALAVYFMRPASPDNAAAGGNESGPAADVPVVTVSTPGRSGVARTLTASGSLAARREVPIGVVGEGGRVTRVLVDAGDWVKQGQTLVVVDRAVQTQQIEGLRAQVGVADADLRLAQSELDRALKLVERGFISKADIDRRTATRDAARARVGAARASVGEAQARTARLNISAPSSGLILSRAVEVGQVISAGSGALFTMAQGGELEMRAQLNEADLAQLSVGVPAKITPVGTERVFDGQIWQIAETVDSATRQGIARIAVPYDAALRPGGFATAQINAGGSDLPVLPVSAVQSDDKGSYVLVVGAGSKVERRGVTTGAVTAKGIAIASGLNGREAVVLFAGGFLTPGDVVKAKRVTPAQTANGQAVPR